MDRRKEKSQNKIPFHSTPSKYKIITSHLESHAQRSRMIYQNAQPMLAHDTGKNTDQKETKRNPTETRLPNNAENHHKKPQQQTTMTKTPPTPTQTTHKKNKNCTPGAISVKICYI